MSFNDKSYPEYEGMVRQIASEYHRKYPNGRKTRPRARDMVTVRATSTQDG